MFKNPFSFEGRIRRTEYGLSVIAFSVVNAIFQVMTQEGADQIYLIIMLLVYIPMFWFLAAQAAKRCHDRGNSGWYQLIPFYGFVLLFGEGDDGYNEYGPNPKGIGNEESDPFNNDFGTNP